MLTMKEMDYVLHDKSEHPSEDLTPLVTSHYTLLINQVACDKHGFIDECVSCLENTIFSLSLC